jgi:signal transduction histidine kinase
MTTATAAGGVLARRYWLVALLVMIVTALHYVTAVHWHAAHGIYRRLYYFPIILAAFRGGWPAGLTTSLVVGALYLPHALGEVGHDPGSPLEKGLEMALYVAVGLVCGVLVTRQQRILRRLAETLAEKHRMETQLLRQARLAAVGRLSAGLAHEIRNPLASLKGAAEILADDRAPDDPRARMLGIIRTEAARLNDVLTRFLDFARPADREPRRCDLAAEARNVVELMRHRRGAADILGPSPQDPPAELLGDREQLRQLLVNLILNGVEAAGEGGRVEVAVSADGDRVRCVVADDGPGFDPDALRQLGTPFFTTKPEGTGLGLAASVRIAEDHGGALTVDESAARGARVVVDLPRAGRPGGR